jgi:hypothetical protein
MSGERTPNSKREHAASSARGARCRYARFVVAKRIIWGLLILTGCAAESSDARRDDSQGPVKETRGAEIPAAPAGERPADAPALLAWSFEPASADCNGWPVLGADAIRASPAHSGAYSCKVCANGSGPDLELSQELGGVAAGRYVLTAWVRKRAATAAPAEAHASIEAETSDGATLAASPTVAVREEWARLEATLELATGASRLRLRIGSPITDVARCLFVDDVTLARQ